ncbi:MAG: DUF4262 domain-containing protein [Proteobacteria bacterium]|nr:DUF4262 domain-containing protein [Pseudomonadota bacterium]
MFDSFMRNLHHRDTKRRVRRHGWTAIYVGDYQNAPTWAYTIGFHSTLGAPEVIVFDVPMASANSIFHAIYSDLKSGKLVMRDGEPWRPDEFEHPLIWREVHATRLYDGDPENPWLGLAEDFAMILAPGKGPITAFQLVITDANGHVPWEPQYDESLRPLQRELYLPVGDA